MTEPRVHFRNATRYIVLLLATACLTFCVANPLILNFTVICMDGVVTEYKKAYGNSSSDSSSVHWLEDPFRRNLLFSAVAIGNLIGLVPTTYILQRFGARCLFLMFCLLSALSTALFPLAVSINIYPLIFLIRLLQGFSQSFTMAATGSVCSTWSPLKECGMYMAVLSTHYQLSAIFTMPVSSAFCVTSIGWQGVFYLQAILTAIACTLFHFFFHDQPSMHRNVSSKELSRISVGKEGQDSQRSVPFGAIIRTPVIIGIWTSSFGGFLGFLLLQQFGAIYLNKVLHLEVASTGIATALPFILSAAVKFAAGPISDKAVCLSEKTRLLMFASLSQGLMAICYLTMAITSTPWISQAAYTAAITCSGLNVIGVGKCSTLVARQFAPFVMTVQFALGCVANLLLPAVIAGVAESNSQEQWSYIFYGVVVIVLASNAIFLFVATAEPAPWTKSEIRPEEILKKALE